ncbi:HAD family hydrolase [Promicromonospora sp. NFX87]|uniref:HAD family hydrolase n=1 Tax=Promicromonospora sp. NFX87 TaxID=3402691 RepID=UPI003AFA19AB
MPSPRTDDAQGSIRHVRAVDVTVGAALIALDIDGTLLKDRGTVPEETVAAVADVRQSGHHVVLASGRSLAGVLPVARQLGIDMGWVVASNGAVVARLDAGQPGGYELDTVHTFDVEPVIRRARALVPAVQVGVEEIGWGYRVTRPFEPSSVNGEQREVPDAELWDVPATRAILRGDGVARLVEPLRSLGVTPVPAASDWVDVTPRDLSKATGLERIREQVGADSARTVAVGDGVNDLEMIVWAARGVAMGHSPAVLRDAADEVTGTIDEHGVVPVLRSVGTTTARS